MSDQQKIWFIYLTDHHEGPFTPAEVAEKVAQGAVTPQSLGWKDGMPEWVALESIPDLAAAIGSGASAAPAPAAPAAAAAPAPAAAGGEEGFSLAALLAQQQGGSPAPAEDQPSISSNTSVLSSMVGSVQAAHPLGTGSLSLDGQTNAGLAAGTGSFSQSISAGPDEDVWTLRIGDQVSGLHSLNKLRALAAEGEVPADAMLWRTGWPDFQPIAAVPEVASARKSKKAGGATLASQSMARPGTVNAGKGRPSGLAPITAAANVGDDDPTDPSILMDRPKKGIMGILERIKGLLKKRQPQAKAAPSGMTKPGIQAKPAASRFSGGGAMVRKVAALVGAIAVLGGGAAAYFLFLSSPIPSDLDVLPEDLENMRALVKESASSGGKLYLALARGTEDNPADDTAPKLYVATNLPEGTSVSLQLTGQKGTLVNRLAFEKSYGASVGKNHIATFEKVDDDGKPLPMGDYSLKVSAEGAEPLQASRFLGGKKGGIYADRLKKYKDRLQGEYDKEMQELKELVDTLKSLQTDVSARLAEYRTGWPVAGNRAKITADWKAYVTGAQNMAAQLEEKLKGRASASTQTFHPRAFQDVGTTLAQLRQLFQMHSQRIEGSTPSGNPDETEGLMQAGVVSLEQFLSQALVKSPFDVMDSEAPAGGAAAPAPHGGAPSAAPTSAPPAAAGP